VMSHLKILTGDCRALLRDLPAESINCVVTSPPYWGLRDYKLEPLVWGGELNCQHEWNEHTVTRKGSRADRSAFCRCGAWHGVHGLEPTVDLYVHHSVEIFREVRRVLQPDGTLWLNLGDSYAGSWGAQGHRVTDSNKKSWHGSQIKNYPKRASQIGTIRDAGLKPKDLVGVPWRVAFALQADGWYIRQDIIWMKPNPMPESVTDRCTKAHEYLFLFSKSERYYFNSDAIKEPAAWNPQNTKFPDGWDTGAGGHGTFHRNGREKGKIRKTDSTNESFVPNASPHTGLHRAGTPRGGRAAGNKSHKGVAEYESSATEEHRTGLMNIAEIAYETRNKRSVWTIASKPFRGAHFATFPPKLVEPCILAGCPEGGIVLDPFAGAGTVALVARDLGRHCVLMEQNPEYVAMTERRLAGLPVETRARLEAELAVLP
jgi:DNA modification methylase